MAITQQEAKKICTKEEWELVESSFAPAIKKLTPTRLRSKISRARKLQDKYRELGRRQHRALKDDGSTREDGANERTERKAQLFEEARQRFEQKLATAGQGAASGG